MICAAGTNGQQIWAGQGRPPHGECDAGSFLFSHQGISAPVPPLTAAQRTGTTGEQVLRHGELSTDESRDLGAGRQPAHVMQSYSHAKAPHLCSLV